MTTSGPITRGTSLIRSRPLSATLIGLAAAATVAPGDPWFAVPTSLFTVVPAVLLVGAVSRGWKEEARGMVLLLPVAAGALVTLGQHRIEGTPVWAIRGWAWLALIAVWALLKAPQRSFRTPLVILVVGTAVAFTVFGPLKIDVWHLHDQAIARVASGLSPYSGLNVIHGSPAAEPGELLLGYAYPLVAFAPFMVSGLMGLDPRVGGAAVWIVAMTLLAWSVRRRGGSTGAVMAIILAPAWMGVLWSATTEPITGALFIATGAAGAAPILGGALLGLALASKQYLVVLAPLLLAPAVTRNRARLVTAVLTAGLAAGGGFLIDSAGYWDNAILFHLSHPARTDTINPVSILTSLGWTPPFVGILAVAVGLVTAWRLRIHGTNWSQWFLAAAAVLAVTFVLTPQAYPNYWFLVLVLVLLSLATEEDVTTEPATP
jgi:hypothetical protein